MKTKAIVLVRPADANERRSVKRRWLLTVSVPLLASVALCIGAGGAGENHPQTSRPKR